MKLDIEFKDDKIGQSCSVGSVGSAGSVPALLTEQLDSLSSSSEGDLRATRPGKLVELDYRVRDQVKSQSD